ncbi:MAG: extracellular solute-binding protein, partial [Rhodothermales bacterium]
FGVSLAGGASLVLFDDSPHKEEAWAFVEFLSRPEIQAQFYGMTGNLPARMDAWELMDLQNDRYARAFWRQLQRVHPTPKVPEWERIATKIFEYAEEVIQGSMSIDRALQSLDRDVDIILEKRRWMIEQRP